MSVRVRFAPSPTGSLHVGNALDAVANRAYADAHGGQLVLRLDDTDATRVVPGGEEAVLADLAWLGIDWEEVPIRQSDRADVYVSGHAHHLELRRLEDCGTTFVVAGGGGAHLYPIRRGDPHVKFAASEHGFTDLLFWAGGARVTFWNTHGDKLYENEVVR